MFRRIYPLPVILLILSLALAACGGDGPDRPPVDSAAATQAGPAAVEGATTGAGPGAVEGATTSAGPATGTGVTTVEGATTGAGPATGTGAETATSGGTAGAGGTATFENGLSTVEVVKILTPSVVQILTESVVMGMFNQPVPSSGVGTGIILDETGNILTNNHVIAGAQRITVTLSDGASLPAQLIGGDPSTDTAIVRIQAEGLQPAKLGNSSELQVGEDVIAIGHALGLPGGPTVSKGVVSALGRSIDINPQTTILDLIQTDAAINPGNSGGPLVNRRAEVIGINSAGIPESQDIGFAISIDGAEVVVAQLMERGFVNRGFLGISPLDLPPGAAQRLRVPVDEGIVVIGVVPNSPAMRAGLREGDVIVRINGEAIPSNAQLSKFLISRPPGETVTISLFRGSSELEIDLTLGERPRR